MVASLLIPAPMFPGNVFCKLIGISAVEYSLFLSVVFNGVFYGSILWLVFVVISRRFEENSRVGFKLLVAVKSLQV